MIVAKFGGTSVQSADSMKQVLNCVLQIQSENITIVLSAISGATDLLLSATNNSINNYDKSIEIIENLRIRHLEILTSLIPLDNLLQINYINSIFDDIISKLLAFNSLSEITNQNIDSVQSYGELLSTYIFSHFLHSRNINNYLLDARSVIKTDSNFTIAKVDYDASCARLQEYTDVIKSHKIIVTQGFIASDNRNRPTTFGRGGSDYSASLIGSILKSIHFDVREIQIWTDVNGILTADPRIISNAQTLNAISGDEIRILSHLGAKVLHPDTIKPAFSSNITVRVFNTFHPNEGNTTIFKENLYENCQLKSLVNIGDSYEVSLKAPTELSAFDFLSRMLEIAKNSGCKNLYSSATDSVATIYINENSELFTISSIADLINIKKVYMIALVGCNADKEVMHISQNLSINMTICGINKNVIFLKSDSQFDKNILEILHSQLILTKREYNGKIS